MNSSFANDEQSTAVRMYALSPNAKNLGGLPFVEASTTTTSTSNVKSTSDVESNPDLEKEKALNTLKAREVNQRMLVRTLKKESKPFDKEVAELQLLLKQVAELEAELAKGKARFDLELFQNLLKRRMIVIPGFEIHGGVAGLMDLGPIGAVLKDNILNVWKKHFIVREQMLQVDCTNITPHSVLLTSGHVDRFTDLLVEELDESKQRTGEFHRADKILEAFVEKQMETCEPEKRKEWDLLFASAGSLDQKQMDETITRLNIRGPVTKRELSPCTPFNLMFATSIGPSGVAKAYLRPETAQGIFVNFKRLLEYNAGRMPFASAQVGTGFRNEIAPKGGLIRCREFTMAEIEHFVHENQKDHERFDEVKDMVLQLFPRDAQVTTFETIWMSAGEAVERGMINNQTLAYYMARSQEFLLKIGIDAKRLRFRQHLKTEMAHYASDCWDAEVKLSTGWLEIAGHADRSCFDLSKHSEATGEELKASIKFDKPIRVPFTKMEGLKKEIGSAFKKQAGVVLAYLESLDKDASVELDNKLNTTSPLPVQIGTETFMLNRNHCKLIQGEKVMNEERYYPHVIEPSFGIGRIMQSVLEHSFWVKGGDDQTSASGGLVRNVLSLNALVAPVKCGVIPHGATFDSKRAKQLTLLLCEEGWNASIDPSGAAIGRKYARFDEAGVPYVVTMDDRTMIDNSVTIRERDSEEQVRLQESEVEPTLRGLCLGKITWKDCKNKFPIELRPTKD
ncbi:glycine-tRNA ligase [Batrachochytrium salamandrivorans]|nr:glycine-tRNA ligase [Batrachochytrium salamandrivorans]